jgi:hypothetical protein
MKKIFTTKVSLQSSNPTYSYPLIRLPRELKELAGQTVSIYQTNGDCPAFFIVPHLDNLDRSMERPDWIDQSPANAPIDQRQSKTDGLEAIRTPDLRRVKAMS